MSTLPINMIMCDEEEDFSVIDKIVTVVHCAIVVIQLLILSNVLCTVYISCMLLYLKKITAQTCILCLCSTIHYILQYTVISCYHLLSNIMVS